MALRADPPDALDSGSYDLSSTSTYTSSIPQLVLGMVMVLVAFALSQGVFATVRPALMNVPVVGSLMSSGGGGGGPWEGV